MGKTVKDQLGQVVGGADIGTSPVVILVNPQLGENIGAACRAMLNFGLTELRLVAPVSYTHLTLPTIYSV